MPDQFIISLLPAVTGVIFKCASMPELSPVPADAGQAFLVVAQTRNT